MPIFTMPLVGNPNTRTRAHSSVAFDKDQILRAVRINKEDDGYSVEKRSGLGAANTISSGNAGTAIHISSSTGAVITAFTVAGESSIFSDATNCGTITNNYVVRHISERVISGVTYYLLSAVDSTDVTATQGWFLASDAFADTSFTADTTNGSAVLLDVQGETGVYPGQAISGTSIAAGARILTVDSPTQITMTINATGTTGNTVVTKTPIALIIDADFPTGIVGEFMEIDGYGLIATQGGLLYNSDLNSVTAWSALGFLSANQETDSGVGLARYKAQILFFGAASIEYFYNAGNATGSPLTRISKAVSGVGAYLSANSPRASCIASGLDMIVWAVGVDVLGTMVYMISPEGMRKISTPAIETLFALDALYAISITRDVSNTNICLSGKIGSSVLNFLYCVENGLWTDAAYSIVTRFSTALRGSGGSTQCIDLGGTTGAVFAPVATTFTDNAAAFTMTIQKAKWDAGTNKKKFVSEIELLGSDIQSSGATTLNISTDDFATQDLLGTFDNTLIDPVITRCGSFAGGASFQLTHNANTAWRAKALRITYELET